MESTPDEARKGSKKRRKVKASYVDHSHDSESLEQKPFPAHIKHGSTLTPNFDQLGLTDAESFRLARGGGQAVDAEDVAALTAHCMSPGLFSPGGKFFDSTSPRPTGGGAAMGALHSFGKLMGTPNGARGECNGLR